jgi:hypothetical protein
MKTNFVLITLVLFAALLAGCGSRARVGELWSESKSVELGDSESVHIQIHVGAGDLEIMGGAAKLLEADFTYNVARLKPEMDYTDGTLVVWQPGAKGLPVLRDITDYRNEWGLRLNNEVPMDLSVDVGAGSSDLWLADLSLTGLAITLGAGGSTIDLSGDWTRDLDVTIHAGAGDITVRLPKDVGTRVQIDAGVGAIEAPDLEQDGNSYTNATYGESDMTLHVDIEAGVGQINLELEE